MNTDTILTALRSERDRIESAIAALEGSTNRRRGRPAGRHMSAAARARISKAMKRRWASGKMKGNRKKAA